jgi:hypothetical protein
LFAVLALALLPPELALAKPKDSDEKDAAAEEVDLDQETKAGEGDEAKDSGQDDDGSAASKDEGDSEESSGGGGDTTKDQGSDADTSPEEKKGKSYYFVGLRARAVVIPTFIIEAFGDGGKTVMGPSIGPEFGIRKDNFEYDFAITYTAYPMDWTPFKAPTDQDIAMELVKSEIKVLYFTADFLWSHQFSPVVGLMYGGSAGLGAVWGPLYRVQAYRDGAGAWRHCVAPNNPPTGGYCAPDPQHGTDQHFGDYQEPSWFGGGDKPAIMPWLALQMGLRIKPHRRFVGRLDFGIGIGQIFFGLGADYGL